MKKFLKILFKILGKLILAAVLDYEDALSW